MRILHNTLIVWRPNASERGQPVQVGRPRLGTICAYFHGGLRRANDDQWQSQMRACYVLCTRIVCSGRGPFFAGVVHTVRPFPILLIEANAQMPIKLQVERKGDEGKDPADYLFEQERIRLGRASDNDLTLPDQEISQHHAEVVHEDGEYKLRDLGSKNHTFVHGQKLGADDSYTLRSGDVFAMGSFHIEFVPLFMPSSEQTALADEDEPSNPFERHARELKRTLHAMMETYTYAPSDMRESELKRTLEEVLESRSGGIKVDEHDAVKHLATMVLGGDTPQQARAEAGTDVSGETPAGAASTDESGAATEPASDLPAHVDEVINVLVEAVARTTSIPRKFWREFSGNTVVHPPDRAFMRAANLRDLRAHLLDPEVSEGERKKRLSHLKEAVDTLVWHEVSLLNGYKSAVAHGSDVLLDKLNPESIRTARAEGDGFLNKVFGGGGGASQEKASVDVLYKRWKALREQSPSALEKAIYRPAFTEAYLERMADSWGVDKEDIAQRTESDNAS